MGMMSLSPLPGRRLPIPSGERFEIQPVSTRRRGIRNDAIVGERAKALNQRFERQRVERLPFGNRPQPHSAVVSSRGDALPIRGNRNAPDRRLVSYQQVGLGAISAADPNDAVAASGDNLASGMPC